MTLYLAALALARALDATSACHAFAHGAVEVNPFMPQSCAAQVAVQAGAAVG